MTSILEKNKPHRWSEEQREVLCVLKRWFVVIEDDGATREPTGDEYRQVLCGYFAETFHRRGGEKALGSNAVDAQYREMCVQRPTAWTRVAHTPFKDPNTRWKEVKLWLSRVAFLLGINLAHRVDDYGQSQGVVKSSKRYKRRYLSLEDTPITEPGSDYGSVSSDSEVTPTKRRNVLTAPMAQNEAYGSRKKPWIGLSVETLLPHDAYHHFDKDGNAVLPYKFSDDTFRYSHRTDHQIAFRCWDDNPVSDADVDDIEGVPNPILSGTHGTNTPHGFWAGAFRVGSEPPPSRNDQETFGTSIFTHLRPLKEPSPWISIWISLIASVHRLLKTTSAHLTLIDLDQLGSLKAGKYPSIYPASTIIWQYRLKEIPYSNGVRYRYGGQPEFIVWQHIPKQTILSSISHGEFVNFIQANPVLQRVLSLNELAKARTVGEFRQLQKRRDFTHASMDRTTGEAIGAALAFAKVPERLVQKTASVAGKDWKFIKGSGHDLKSYMVGVEAGYHSYSTPLRTLNLGNSNTQHRFVHETSIFSEQVTALLSGEVQVESDQEEDDGFDDADDYDHIPETAADSQQDTWANRREQLKSFLDSTGVNGPKPPNLFPCSTPHQHSQSHPQEIVRETTIAPSERLTSVEESLSGFVDLVMDSDQSDDILLGDPFNPFNVVATTPTPTPEPKTPDRARARRALLPFYADAANQARIQPEEDSDGFVDIEDVLRSDKPAPKPTGRQQGGSLLAQRFDALRPVRRRF